MKFTAPQSTDSFALDSNDPLIQQMVIDTLKKNDIKVYDDTNCFDPTYPILAWEDGKLTQLRKNGHKVVCSLEAFMLKFKSNPHIHSLQLNENYNATVDLKEKTVKVGCQTFDFETINKLSELMKKEI